MPTLVEQVQAAAATFLAEVALLVADSEKLDAVVHGPASGPASLVDLGSPAGIVKTIARVIAEGEASFVLAPRIITVAGSYAVADADALIVANLSAPGTINLALDAVAAHATPSLRYVDFAGNATAVFTPNGSETIMGKTSPDRTWTVISGGAGLGGKIEMIPSAGLGGWAIAVG